MLSQGFFGFLFRSTRIVFCKLFMLVLEGAHHSPVNKGAAGLCPHFSDASHLTAYEAQ